MQATRPLPAAVRAVNVVGRNLRRLGVPLIRLDEPSLLAAATRRTGLADFGPDTFREGLRSLIDSLESEAALSTLGRFIARTEIVMFLENRLRLQDWRRRHPEIAEVRIERPVFIIGMPRTGTSILHEIIAQDPNVRVPMTWEVDRPFPPPEAASYTTDARIREVQRNLDRSESLIPDFKRMHPMGAELPQECVRMTAIEFASMIFHTTYRVPSYARWLHDRADLAPVYASHRRFLQQLGWRCARERWVLKSPGHLWAIEDLMREYPDACLVQTHRDPLKITASLTSLVSVLRTMASERVDRLEIAHEWSEHVRTGLEKSVEARKRGVVPSAQVIDVQFRDFMKDQIGTIRTIYQRFGMRLTPEAESRMRAFIADNPDDKHGKHAYRFADTGLELDQERARSEPYQDFFGVPSEQSV
jgi:hypothetical protein